MARYKLVVHNIPFGGVSERIPVILGAQERFSVIVQGSKTHSLTIEGLLSVISIDEAYFDMALDCSTILAHSLTNLLDGDISTQLDSQAKAPVVTHSVFASERTTFDMEISRAISIVIATAYSDIGISIGTDIGDVNIILVAKPESIIKRLSASSPIAVTTAYEGTNYEIAIKSSETPGELRPFVSAHESLLLDGRASLTFPVDFEDGSLLGINLYLSESIPEAVVYKIHFLYNWSDYSLSDLSEMTLSNMHRSEVIE